MTSEELAWKIRRHGVEMCSRSGASHIGAILSVADILAVLYADFLNVRPDMPAWPERDRFVLSKGHAAAALYACLGEMGFFPVEELMDFYQNGSGLMGHVSHHVPGVEFSTGSLGHGICAAVGMAIAAKQDKQPLRVCAVVGDGECSEGTVWEAAQLAAFFRLDNLTVIVDHNKMQSLDTCEKTLLTGTLAEKWRSFGWHTVEVDGHDHSDLRRSLNDRVPGKPSLVIAHTVKGKGVPFMENDVLWHYRFPHEGWEYDGAVQALHQIRPAGVADIYTPRGIPNPVMPDWETVGDHTLSATYHPTWREHL